MNLMIFWIKKLKNPNRKNILNSSKYRYGVHNSKAMAHWPKKGEKSNNSDYDYYLPFEFEHQFKKSESFGSILPFLILISIIGTI